MATRNKDWELPDCAICRGMVEDGWGRWSNLRQELASIGYWPRRCEQVPDAELQAALLELIGKLAEVGVFIEDTDHLDDRALYEELTGEFLERYGVHDPQGVLYVPIAAGDDYWRYLASESEREWARRELPELDLPPSEPRPHGRDRLLPRPERHAWKGESR